MDTHDNNEGTNVQSTMILSDSLAQLSAASTYTHDLPLPSTPFLQTIPLPPVDVPVDVQTDTCSVFGRNNPFDSFQINSSGEGFGDLETPSSSPVINTNFVENHESGSAVEGLGLMISEN